MPLNEFVSSVREEIYRRVKEEQEGEMDEEKFNEVISDILHDEVDTQVSYKHLGEVEELVCEYGISKSFVLYMNEYGADGLGDIQVQFSYRLLYAIVIDELRFDYDEFKWFEYLNDVDNF